MKPTIKVKKVKPGPGTLQILEQTDRYEEQDLPVSIKESVSVSGKDMSLKVPTRINDRTDTDNENMCEVSENIVYDSQQPQAMISPVNVQRIQSKDNPYLGSDQFKLD